MTTIRFFPWNRTAQADEGDSLLDAAIEAGIPLPHSCGGDAVCSTCAIEVEQGSELLSPMEEMERETLDKLLSNRSEETRLSCQVCLEKSEGEVVVRSLEEG